MPLSGPTQYNPDPMMQSNQGYGAPMPMPPAVVQNNFPPQQVHDIHILIKFMC